MTTTLRRDDLSASDVLAGIDRRPRTPISIAMRLHTTPPHVVRGLLTLLDAGKIRCIEQHFGGGCTGSMFVILDKQTPDREVSA